MRIHIRKYGLLRDIFMKLFIFITVFYSFYISITDALGLSEIPAVIIAVIIVMGMLLTNNVKLHFKDVAVFLGFFILCLMNIWIFNVEISDYVKTFLFCFMPMILAGCVIDIEKYQGFIYKTSCLYIVVLFVYVARYYIGTLNLYSTDSMDIMGFAYYSIPYERNIAFISIVLDETKEDGVIGAAKIIKKIRNNDMFRGNSLSCSEKEYPLKMKIFIFLARHRLDLPLALCIKLLSRK